MDIDRSIDRLIQKAQESTLKPERKAQAIRILEAIRRALQAVQGFVTGIIAAIRERKDAVGILALALMVAVLAKAIPLIGDLIGFLVILVGVGAAFAVEVRRILDGLFDLETAVPATE